MLDLFYFTPCTSIIVNPHAILHVFVFGLILFWHPMVVPYTLISLLCVIGLDQEFACCTPILHCTHHTFVCLFYLGLLFVFSSYTNMFHYIPPTN